MPNLSDRRAALMQDLPDNSVAVIRGATDVTRKNDTEYPFAQNADFMYLSGFNEANAVMVIRKQQGQVSSTLFCQAKDQKAEKWTGERIGLERAKDWYGFENAVDIKQIDTAFPELLRGMNVMAYLFGCEDTTKDVQKWRRTARTTLKPAGEDIFRLREVVPTTFQDISATLNEMRLIKAQEELAQIQKAVDISVKGFKRVIRKAKRATNECQLAARFQFECQKRGAAYLAYGSVMAAGNQANTLHYVANDARIGKNDLVLMDAGCEWKGYASDITRTFPVSGKFTDPQKRVYEVVLKAQEAGIKAIKPGNTYEDPHKAVLNSLVEGMITLGLLTGTVTENIKSKAYEAYYPHSFGHWMGLDVHDVGEYRNKTDGYRKFEPGMVLTVEPGIYIDEDDDRAPAELRGIGVRIEDDVLVTQKGAKVLSWRLPKTVEGIEKLMNEPRKHRSGGQKASN